MERFGLVAAVGLVSALIARALKSNSSDVDTEGQGSAAAHPQGRKPADASTGSFRFTKKPAAARPTEQPAGPPSRMPGSAERQPIATAAPLQSQASTSTSTDPGTPHEVSRRDRRIVVFDTNALISNPHCIYGFGSSDICIPATVLTELERNKTHSDPRTAFMVRRALAMLFEFRQVPHPHVKGAHPIFLQTRTKSPPAIFFPRGEPSIEVPEMHPKSIADDRIALTALAYKKERNEVLFVTGDKALFVRARDLLEVKFVPPKSISELRREFPKQDRGSNQVDEDAYDQLTADLYAMYELSRGREEMSEMTFQEMLRAAEGGNSFAQRMVGFFYFAGEGTPKNREAACHWLAQAALQGDPDGIEALRVLALAGPMTDASA